MKTTEIHTSRLKTAGLLCVCFGFVTLSLLAIKYPPPHRPVTGLPNVNTLSSVIDLQVFGVFWSLAACGMVWLLIRPWRLLLDEEGFTLTGGFNRSPRRELWRDINHFFVYYRAVQLSGIETVAYNYKPGVRKTAVIGNVADRKLPTLWPLGPEDMVDKLNAYRLGDGA